jgi:hypothetical protein
MATKLFGLVAFLLLGNGNAFVVPRPTTTTTASLSPAGRTATSSRLHLLDDSAVSVLQSMSTLLSDATVSAPPEAGGLSYSRASYYTILGLYAISLPGLWSTVKRSTKAKVKRKTYVTPGPKQANGKDMRQQAGEIMACK